MSAHAAGFADQEAVLNDGTVTETEYLNSTIAARQCAAAAGTDVRSITRRVDGTLNYSFSVHEGLDEAAVVAAADRCDEEHSKFVELGFRRSTPGPSDLEIIRACVAEHAEESGVSAEEVTPVLIGQSLTSKDPKFEQLQACVAVANASTVVVE